MYECGFTGIKYQFFFKYRLTKSVIAFTVAAKMVIDWVSEGAGRGKWQGELCGLLVCGIFELLGHLLQIYSMFKLHKIIRFVCVFQ